jgi:hypothetical protein
VRVTEDFENVLPESEETVRQDDARPFSPDEMVTCGECLRANPPTRANCFYCSAKLPQTETTAAQRSRRPSLRRPEAWEEGYNLVLVEPAPASSELIKEVTGLLRLESGDAARILASEEPLPLVRLDSYEEARLVEERFRGCGLSILVISDSDLMMRDENRRRVRAFDFEDDALVAYASGSSDVRSARWSDLQLLVTGRLIVRRIEVEERRKGRAGEMVEAREMTGDLLLLDLYAKSFVGAWRVASDSFDFSCLRERKALIAAQNFSSLIEVLRELAPQMIVDDSYNRSRRALASVWPPEERTESKGLRRERPGRFNVEAVMKSDNEMQFTRYSRLRYFLRQREAHSDI